MSTHSTSASILDTPNLLRSVIKTARGAGGILNDYQNKQSLFLEINPDTSPVTIASLESNEYITEQLTHTNSKTLDL